MTVVAAAADVFDVEMQIANVSNFNYELRNSEAMYNPTTLAAMTTPGLFSFTRWASGLVPPPSLLPLPSSPPHALSFSPFYPSYPASHYPTN